MGRTSAATVVVFQHNTNSRDQRMPGHAEEVPKTEETPKSIYLHCSLQQKDVT